MTLSENCREKNYRWHNASRTDCHQINRLSESPVFAQCNVTPCSNHGTTFNTIKHSGYSYPNLAPYHHLRHASTIVTLPRSPVSPIIKRTIFFNQPRERPTMPESPEEEHLHVSTAANQEAKEKPRECINLPKLQVAQISLTNTISNPLPITLATTTGGTVNLQNLVS